MSDTQQTPRPQTRRGATKQRLLEAGRLLFSARGYDGVGVREIAAEAGADPALLIRYFGSKEALFRQIASEAFDTEDLLVDGVAALPERISALLFGEEETLDWREGYDSFRLLLSSIGSATAGPILAEYLEKDFVALAEALGAPQGRERAAALTAHILGFALVRVTLTSLDASERAAVRRLLSDAISACLTSSSIADSGKGG